MTHNSGSPRSGGGTPITSPGPQTGRAVPVPTGTTPPSLVFPDGNTKGKGAKYSAGKRGD